MAIKYSVTLRNDDEGMFSTLSSDELETVDVSATIAKYEEQVTKALRKALPELALVHEFGTYGGRSVIFDGLDIDDPDAQWMEDVIQDVVGKVCNMGNFWVTK